MEELLVIGVIIVCVVAVVFANLPAIIVARATAAPIRPGRTPQVTRKKDRCEGCPSAEPSAPTLEPEMTKSRVHPAVAVSLLLFALVLALPGTEVLGQAKAMIMFVIGLYYR